GDVYKRQRDLRAKIERAGMTIERLTHANTLMLPVIAARRLLQRLCADATIRSDLTPLPRALNALLSVFYIAEMQLVARVDVPFGVSVVTLARKDGERRTKDG
ncbi:MAG: hypothetical protein N2559_14660, partial [Anaerolineae bacterium]|nr:hypothetical protein [Anaerolineae bacterium]